MLDHGETKNLIKMLDDRMNYGVFLEEYSAVLALDRLLEKGEVNIDTGVYKVPYPPPSPGGREGISSLWGRL